MASDENRGSAEKRARSRKTSRPEPPGPIPEPLGPSDVALRVRRLQSAVLGAAARRKRLPQPLFWSLFHNELEEIKRTKEQKRLISKLIS